MIDILIVEDNKELSDLLCDFLRQNLMWYPQQTVGKKLWHGTKNMVQNSSC